MTKNLVKIGLQSIQCQTEDFVFGRRIDEGCRRPPKVCQRLNKNGLSKASVDFCRNMGEEWTKVALLVFVACFGRRKLSTCQSMCSVRALVRTELLVITAFGFYTAGAGQKGFSIFIAFGFYISVFCCVLY